ncbi:diacylglycerol kinase family lipid kinase [Streptomyces sp. XM4193]|uniref:diacylglycerol/lipid kinase family protein n=1 Tax=Streptomyces sp. XM4193 TaxID=2929782 RepID=UPI001FF9169F|nr:diacylglycerol kinase family protein [Streptomyces sp. XM4193]MCK1798336.1 diacylglycerol kinase family lipid kinase [Streptomyces sp. XM4193]
MSPADTGPDGPGSGTRAGSGTGPGAGSGAGADGAAGAARTFTALVNPISGGGTAWQYWQPVAGRLSAAGATVHSVRTTGREDAVERAERAAAQGHIVVAVGGDGLVRDAAEGVVASGGVLAIAPAGRGNDLAKALGVPREAAALAELLLRSAPTALDVAEVNGVIAPGNVYVGIDSMATRIINDNRWMPGLLLYRLAPVRAIMKWRAVRYELVVDGETRRLTGHTVIVANSGAYGHGLRIVPSAVPDDGELDLLTVGDGPRRQVVRFMNKVKDGTHVDRPEVTVERVRTVTIDADRPVPVCVDGDEVTTLPAEVTIRPGALNCLVPEGS